MLEVKQKLYRFRKEERISSEKTISLLFTNGFRFRSGCLLIVYLFDPKKDYQGTQVLISVPKKLFRRAVIRNLLKRRIREAYRLNRQPLVNTLAHSGKSLLVAIIYNDKMVSEYRVIEASWIKAGTKLLERIEDKKDKNTKPDY
jgi:ribonuclease P protein component